jgi:hypothetical protein
LKIDLPGSKPGEKGEEEKGGGPPATGPGKSETDVPGGGILPPQEGSPPGQEKQADPEPAAPPVEGAQDGQVENVMDRLNHPPGMRLRSPQTAIFVVGSSDFLSNNMIRNSPYTWNFFSNAIDYLTIAEGFGNIRTRETSTRLIDPVYRDNLELVNFYKLVGTLGGALCVVILGLILYYFRKAAQKKEVVL